MVAEPGPPLGSRTGDRDRGYADSAAVSPDSLEAVAHAAIRSVGSATALRLGSLSRMSGTPREPPCVGGEGWAWSAAEQGRGRGDRCREMLDARRVPRGAELRVAAEPRASLAGALAAGVRARCLALSELWPPDDADRGDHRQVRGKEDARPARRVMQRAHRRRQVGERRPGHTRATRRSAAVRTPRTPRSRVMTSGDPRCAASPQRAVANGRTYDD